MVNTIGTIFKAITDIKGAINSTKKIISEIVNQIKTLTQKLRDLFTKKTSKEKELTQNKHQME